MNTINYGFLASIIGIISFLPIVYNIVQTQNTDNFVWSALILALIASFLRILEGNQIGSTLLILSGTTFMILNLIIVFVKIK